MCTCVSAALSWLKINILCYTSLNGSSTYLFIDSVPSLLVPSGSCHSRAALHTTGSIEITNLGDFRVLLFWYPRKLTGYQPYDVVRLWQKYQTLPSWEKFSIWENVIVSISIQGARPSVQLLQCHQSKCTGKPVCLAT